jgi:site-specific DNA recombinase
VPTRHCLPVGEVEWRKDPDTGQRMRIERPESAWITRLDESRRLIADELWHRAQRRARSGDHQALKTGGKPKYLLSGLLRCAECGAHYIIANQREYSCSSYHDGRACRNSARVARAAIERIVLDPLRKELLAPGRVQRMATEMQAVYIEHVTTQRARLTDRPKALQELDARLAKLRDMQRASPDMADELQAAVDRAKSKRRELENAQPAAKQSAKLLMLVPRMAEEYRRQIELGLDGNPRAALTQERASCRANYSKEEGST